LELFKILGGAANAGFGALLTLLKSGFSTAVKFHQEGIAFAREMGMSAHEAQAYTEVLTQRTENLAAKYGVAAEQVIELQKNLSVATSRQLMLNDAQSEQFLQINKLVGSSTVSKFTEELMNGMGGNIESVTGAVSKAYVLASKSGLNAQKISEKIANNLNLANKLSFRTGIDGLTRMAMQAEKIGMNLQSIESVANKFMDFESAIESSAQLSMLGGAAGAIGGNPLDMMYEANYDPEALQDRLPKMLSGLARFDPTKGVSHLNGAAQDIARNIAKALGIDQGEAVNIAKRVSANKYKEEHIDQRLINGMGLSQEQIDFLINKSDVKEGKVSLTTADNKTIDLGAVSKNSEEMQKILDEMMKYDKMSEKDIMLQNAQTLTSINEQLSGIAASISAMFSGFLNGLLPEMTKDVKDYGAWAKQKLEPLARDVGKSVRNAYDELKELAPIFKDMASGLVSFMRFVTQHWKLTLAAILAIKAAKYIGGISLGSVGAGAPQTVGQAASSKMLGGLGGMFGKMHANSPHAYGNFAYNSYKNAYTGYHGKFGVKGFLGASKEAIGASWRNASKFAKGTALIGGIASAAEGIGAWSAHAKEEERIKNDSSLSEEEKKKALEQNRIDRNSEVGGAVGQGVGAVLGTFFFGPLGGMIGAAVGKFTGELIGKYWDPIWNGIKKGFGLLWDGMKSALKFLIDNNPLAWMARGIGKLFGKDWTPTKLLGFSEGGRVPGSGTKDTVPAMLTPGEIVVPKNKVDDIGANGVTKLPGNIVMGKDDNFERHHTGGAAGVSSYMATNNGISSVILNSQQLSTNVTAKPVGVSSYIATNNGISSVIPNPQPLPTNITAKPVGGKEEIHTYSTNQPNNANVEVTVKDFNINISGTIKLDGGNSYQNIDTMKLLSDISFVSKLKDMIKASIASDINGGKFMYDTSWFLGHVSNATTVSRLER
jgi:hypothetical protein